MFYVRFFFLFVVVQDGLEAYLPMAGLVDKEKERARLEKQAAKLTKDMEVLETRLGGSNFVEKVYRYLPPSLREPALLTFVEKQSVSVKEKKNAPVILNVVYIQRNYQSNIGLHGKGLNLVYLVYSTLGNSMRMLHFIGWQQQCTLAE